VEITFKGIRSLEQNRQKGQCHWKDWEPLKRRLLSHEPHKRESLNTSYKRTKFTVPNFFTHVLTFGLWELQCLSRLCTRKCQVADCLGPANERLHNSAVFYYLVRSHFTVGRVKSFQRDCKVSSVFYKTSPLDATIPLYRLSD